MILKVINNKQFINGSTVKVTTKDILDSNYEKVEDYTGNYEIFNDQTAPAVTDMVLSGSTLTVTFSEPVKTVGSLRVDGKTVGAPTGYYTDSTDAGDYSVEYTITDTDMLKTGTHKAVFYAVEDFAGNSATMVNSSYVATDNNVKPSVQKVEALSTNKFRVTFESPVSGLAASNLVIKKGNHTFETTRLSIDVKNSKVYDVTINDPANTPNPLYGDKENSVNLSVELKDVKGTNNVFGDKYTTNLTLTKDTEKPLVQNSAINQSAGQILTVIFNEELDSTVDVSKISITKDGVRIPVATAALNSTDKKKLEITVDNTGSNAHTVSDGTYKVVLGAGAVADLAGNKNAAQNTEVIAKVVSGTELKPDDSKVTVSQVGSTTQNKITIDFEEEMTNSAVELKNYKIDGVPLDNPLYAGIDIAFTDGNKDKVEIILPKGEVSSSSYTALLEISKDVKSGSGKYISDGSKGTYSVQPAGTWSDDVAPVLQSADFVKANSASTSTNVVKLTFSETVKATDVEDFLVNVGGTNVSVASIEQDNDEEVIIKLSDNVNVAQTGTISITKDEDFNTNGVINIEDLAGNKATEKKVTLGSVVDKTVYDAVNPVVNTPPTGTVADQTETNGSGPWTIDLSAAITDADGDTITFSNAVSGDTGVATVGLSGTNDETLTVTEVSTGTTTISVDYDDGNGGTGTATFDFEIQ